MTKEQFNEWKYTAEDIRDEALRERDRLIKDNKPFNIRRYKFYQVKIMIYAIFRI